MTNGHIHPDEGRLVWGCDACRELAALDQLAAAVDEADLRTVYVLIEAVGRQYEFKTKLPWPEGWRYNDVFRYWTGHFPGMKVTPPPPQRHPLADRIDRELAQHEGGRLLEEARNDVRVIQLELDLTVRAEPRPKVEGQSSLFD